MLFDVLASSTVAYHPLARTFLLSFQFCFSPRHKLRPRFMDWFKKVFSSEPAKDAPKQNDAPAGGDPGRPSVLGNLIASLSLGTDVLRSGLSLPILLHEPMTQLQRSAEMLATAPLLMTATQAKDPQSRMAFVTAFGITGFVGTERLCTFLSPLERVFIVLFVLSSREFDFLMRAGPVFPSTRASQIRFKL
jgi:hypothetical protein